MARRTALNPDGTGHQYGGGVRLERGLEQPAKGEVRPGAKPVWHLFRRVDVKDDEATTYTYRYDLVDTFAEDEPGLLPDAAHEAALKLAGD